MKNKIQYNEITDEIYGKRNIPYFKISLLSIFLIFLGFSLNFPVKNIIIQQVSKALQSNPSCPIMYDEIDVSFFLPKIILKKPIISGRCFKKPAESLKLKNIKISLTGPGFSPLGIKLHALVKAGKTSLNLYPTVSFGSYFLRIDKTKIDSSLINKLTGINNLFSGNLALTSNLSLEKTGPKDGKLLLKSKNLKIPSQNIHGFNVPELNIGNFLLKAVLKDPKKLQINDLIIGNEESPIIATFKGSMKLNKYNIAFSEVDLVGEVKFSQKLLSEIPLGLFLPAKKPENGFYKLKLKGPLNRLSKPEFLD